MSKVYIFQHLGEDETFLVIILAAAVLGVDVAQASEAGFGATVLVDRHEGVPHPFAVLSSISPRLCWVSSKPNWVLPSPRPSRARHSRNFQSLPVAECRRCC